MEMADRGVIPTLLTAAREAPLVLFLSVAFRLNLTAQLCLAGIGMFRILPRMNAAIWLVLGAAAYFLVISGGPEAYSRFRYPLMPIVCLLAAVGAPSVRGLLLRARGERGGVRFDRRRSQGGA